MLELEKRLVALGFLDKAQADGRENAATFNAAMSFQKWAGIGRDGKIGPITRKALDAAKRPTPRTQGAKGKRVEVLLDRQVLLLIWDNTVIRVLHISSGKPGYEHTDRPLHGHAEVYEGLVGALRGVAPVGKLLRRRRRLPRVARRAADTSVTWLRSRAAQRRTVALPAHPRRHAGGRGRQVALTSRPCRRT